MSGAVDLAKKAIELPANIIDRNADALGPVGKLLKNTAAKDLRNSSASLGAIGEGNIFGAVTPYVNRAKEVQGQVMGKKDEPINIAAPADPEALANEANAERRRVKRQAEIDILTDRPGRGGTILTDKFTYNV